jgi:hypothetical protein
MFEACLSKGSEIQCLVNFDELLGKVPRMDDDISKLFREMRDISVSFTPEDLIQNMTSIGTLLISAKTAFVSSSKLLTLSLSV